VVSDRGCLCGVVSLGVLVVLEERSEAGSATQTGTSVRGEGSNIDSAKLVAARHAAEAGPTGADEAAVVVVQCPDVDEAGLVATAGHHRASSVWAETVGAAEEAQGEERRD